MKNAKELIHSEFVPKMILAIYEDKGHDNYIETHVVSKKGEVLEGRPLTTDTVDSLLRSFTESKKEEIKPKGIVPNGVLFIDNEKKKYIWTNQPQQRNLLFTENLKIYDGLAWMPKLCFMAIDRSLYVFAMDKSDNLYRAPFHNVDNNGLVCQGSARAAFSNRSYVDLFKYWETIFFGSKFSHINGGDPIKGDLSDMWRKSIETGAKFDTKILKKMNKKLNDLY